MRDWSRVAEVFEGATERDPADRASFLDEACEGDPQLRAEVESLLAASDGAGGFLEQPAAVAAGLAGQAALLVPGEFLGPYLVEGEIGRGGMGVVYLARDTRLGRQVALKMLPPQLVRDDSSRERLRREARAAATLSHPGIATIYALEEIDGRVCLVSEYLRGATLRDEIRSGPLPVPLLLETAIDLAGALAAAHAVGIVHRDLKPENVRRDESGRPRILDFGIARMPLRDEVESQRLTRTGTVLGTPGYMSPEQLDGKEVDARSDIFSLGVLLFELATGKQPFETQTPESTASRVLTSDPPRMSDLRQGLPPGFETIVRHCLQRDREQRCQSASALVRDLEALQAGRGRIRPGLLIDRSLPTMDAPLPARRWWVWHQVTAIFVEAAMLFPMARLHALDETDMTLAALLVAVAAAVVNGTIRVHLVFTSGFHVSALEDQVRRTRLALQASSLLFGAALLFASLLAARPHTVAAALLAAVGVGWTVTSLLVEPSTRRAAFGS